MKTKTKNMTLNTNEWLRNKSDAIKTIAYKTANCVKVNILSNETAISLDYF